MTQQGDVRGGDDTATTTTIPIGDSAVGLRISTATLVSDGDERDGVKLCVGAGSVSGSVTMRQETAEKLCEALERALAAE